MVKCPNCGEKINSVRMEYSRYMYEDFKLKGNKLVSIEFVDGDVDRCGYVCPECGDSLGIFSDDDAAIAFLRGD